MSWDKWHRDPREGEEPEPPPPCERGRELTAAEMHAELDRILGPAMARIRGLEQSAHRCKHGINTEKAACGTCGVEGL